MQKVKLLWAIAGLFFLAPVGVSAQQTGQLELSMNYPKVHRRIGFQYDGQLSKSPDLKSTLYYSVETRIYALPLSHAMMGEKLIGSFTLPDSAQAFALVFKDDDNTDKNDGRGYVYNVFTADNLPSLGTYASEASFYGNMASLFGITRNFDTSVTLYEKEFAQHPDQKDIYRESYLTAGLYSKDRVSVLGGIKSDWEQMIARKAPEDSLLKVYGILSNFDRGNVQGYKDSVLALYPHGLLSARDKIGPIFNKTTADSMVLAYNNLMEEYKDQKPEDILNPQQFYYIVAKKYWEEKNADKFQQYADKVSINNMRSSIYNSAAWPIAEAQAKDSLDLGVTLAKKSVDAAQKMKDDRPTYYTQPEWDKICQSNYSMVADTYGYLLFQQGKVKDALDIQQKVVDGLSTDADVNGRYIQYLLANSDAETALEKGSDFIKAGHADQNLKQLLEQAYQKVNNNDTGFTAYYDKLEAVAFEHQSAEIKKSMLDEPGHAFTLKDMQGKTVSLDSLKGKVVIVDFWATWCGPCKMSFPGMQMALDKYKNDPEVVFLFIDTWERQPTLEQRKQEIQQLMTDNSYSFHVVLDDPTTEEKQNYKTVSAYGVSGIPTKFVLDKEGKIRFKAIGFDGNSEKLAAELSIMIELAKKANQE
ncbi:Thiol-disulfide isomerase or thioredoxin [Arachidicoccus rhizosphaerae]|uniref:Thiol-disulfide isomerase or thioredoxin n=1 Tax=Arachidicoccus rhizosphaerae TaxID=551991 RepID=A0A1H4AET8_9BACT|nr:TlpA disulfide reductase family protein [Arachidicoccus rhizosphaerae]SEA34248.1 Thiol-disulfide isomerase or thioredoxin [Arachidicoccus rhizosphaerae]